MKPAAWLALALLALAWLAPAVAADTVVYYHTDALRSVSVVTDAQGNVLERTRYAPYGQVLNRPLRDGPGYTGHQEDAATGLVYAQQRCYDPETGRFLSVDPVQADDNGANFNRYRYANNNPYRYTDPDGRRGELIWTATDKVTFRVEYILKGEALPFAAEQMSAEVSRTFSGSVELNGKTISVSAEAVPARDASGKQVNTIDVVPDTAGVTKSGRSETNAIGGNNITLGAGGKEAASPTTAAHELAGHGGGAGDQYKGGLDVNGKTVSSDAPTTSIMRDLSGSKANAQTLREILRAPTNTNTCAKGVHAANGGC